MTAWKSIEYVEDDETNVRSFPIAPGTAVGGPLYRFLAYVPVGTSDALVQAAIGAWGLPITLLGSDLPTDWPADDLRLVSAEALKQGKLVSNEMPGPDYRAVRGEFVGQAMQFAAKVPFEEPPGTKGMYPYQVWKGPDIRFGRPDTSISKAPPPSGLPSNTPAAGLERSASSDGWLWVGLGAALAAGAVWWLRRGKPALPARRVRPA